MKKLDNFIFESREYKLDPDPYSDSSFPEHYTEYTDNEYVMNKILTSDFKYFCEKNFKKIIVNEQELTIPQILQYNEFFLGSLTNIKKKHEVLIEEFSDLIHTISSKSTSNELLYESLLNIIQCILIVSPKTRTEMILHLVKYSNHETIEEKIKAWQCIALISNYICLQENFTLYFLNFIYSINSSTDNYIIKKYSAFAFVNILKNKNLGERTVLPVLSHIKEILKLNKLYLRVYISHEKFIDTYVELYQTVEEVKFHILKTLDIPKEYHTYFGIYEVNDYKNYFDETFIEDFVRCSDVLASFEFSGNKEISVSKKDKIITNKLGYSTEVNRLYLRVRYYYSNPDDIIWEQVQNTFAITEIWRLIISNRIILDKETLLNSVALKLKFFYPKMGIRFITALLNDINKNTAIFGQNSNFKVYANPEQILKLMKNYDKNTLEDLKKKCINIFKRNIMFKTQSFEVELKEDQCKLLKMPSKLFILLGSDRLHICKINLQKLKTILYCTIEKIFLKKNYVVIAINNDNPTQDERTIHRDKDILKEFSYYFTEDKIKYFFKSNQAKKIYQTVINYIRLKLNGFYEQTQIERNNLYKDTYKIVHNIPLLERVKKQAKPIYKVNRYYKKIVFN